MSLQTIFKNEKYIIQRVVKKEETPKTYVVDVFDDELYMCSVIDNDKPVSRLYTAIQLRDLIENDTMNQYEFTKEAYTQCELYFKAVNRVIA